MHARWFVANAVASIVLASSAVVVARQQVPAETPYPGSGLSRQDILQRLTATDYTAKPSIDEGKKLFQTLCSTCHVFVDIGSSVGPDLSTVGSRFRKRDVLESILWPSRTISDQYVMTVLTLDDGTVQSGLVSREDKDYVFLRTATAPEGRGVPVPQARIKDRKDSTVSMMPEGLVSELKLDQIDSLAAFLLTGK